MCRTSHCSHGTVLAGNGRERKSYRESSWNKVSGPGGRGVTDDHERRPTKAKKESSPVGD